MPKRSITTSQLEDSEDKEQWSYSMLVWNGRQQFTGIVRNLAGEHFKLENPEDLSSRRISITKAEHEQTIEAAIDSNVARVEMVDESGARPDLTDLHWPCDDSVDGSTFQMHPSERGLEGRVERNLFGQLESHIRVGDQVKVALNRAAVQVWLSCTCDLDDEGGSHDAHCSCGQSELDNWEERHSMYTSHASECYWAHVLAIKSVRSSEGVLGSEGVEDAESTMLTILTPSELAHIPARLASEPFDVQRVCVFAHQPRVSS